jgi:peptide/nickel transport system ATP-binding protein
VTQHPAHPYTRLLVDSAPDPDRITGTAGDLVRETGVGEPPSLITPPAGCRFHPRCPFVMDKCRTELPPRFIVGDTQMHWAACWLFENETHATHEPQEATA